MTEPTEYRDKRGRVGWQPTLGGQRLYYSFYADCKVWIPRRESGDAPVLTGYRRAVRLGKREQKRRDSRFEEAN